MRWAVTPVVDDRQASDLKDVLQLREMVLRRATTRGRALVCGRATLDFHDAFAVRGKAVEARALPWTREALHARGFNLDAHGEAVVRAGCALESGTALSREASAVIFRCLLLLEKQPFHTLAWFCPKYCSRIRRSDTAPPPFPPCGGALDQSENLVGA